MALALPAARQPHSLWALRASHHAANELPQGLAASNAPSSAPWLGSALPAMAVAAGIARRCRRGRGSCARISLAGIRRPAPELPGLSRPKESAINAAEFFGQADGNDTIKFQDAEGDIVCLVRTDADIEVFVNDKSVFTGTPVFQKAGRLMCGEGYCDVPVHKRATVQDFLSSGADQEVSTSASPQQVAQEVGPDDEDDDFDWVKKLDKTR